MSSKYNFKNDLNSYILQLNYMQARIKELMQGGWGLRYPLLGKVHLEINVQVNWWAIHFKRFFLNNRKEWFWRSIIIMIDTRPQIDVPLPFTRVYLIFRNIEVCQRWFFIRRFWIEVIAGLYEKKLISYSLEAKKTSAEIFMKSWYKLRMVLLFLVPFSSNKNRSVCIFTFMLRSYNTVYGCYSKVTTPFIEVI